MVFEALSIIEFPWQPEDHEFLAFDDVEEASARDILAWANSVRTRNLYFVGNNQVTRYIEEISDRCMTYINDGK